MNGNELIRGRARRRALGRGLAALLGTAAVGLAVSPAASASPLDPASPEPGDGGAALLEFDEPTAAVYDRLEAKVNASEDGRVGVIVLIEGQADGRALATSGSMPPRSVDRMRSALLGEFRGKRLVGLASTRTLPLVAFRADASDLAVLERSELVGGVALDRKFALAPSELTGEPTDAPPAPAELSVAPSAASSNESLTPWWDTWRIGLDRTWRAGYVGAGQTIVILDTGVDGTHPALAGKVVAEACFARYANGAGACPNGSTAQYGPGSARPCSTDCAHGTHVAHTAAGNWGVARGATIVAVQVFHPEWSARYGRYLPMASDFDYVRALEYVWRLRGTFRIAAVNMSLGGGAHAGYCDASESATNYWVYWLKQAGIATVIAAGNDNHAQYLASPACVSHAISVGATTLDPAGNDAVYSGARWGSNSNWTLDLLAPGVGVCSAVPGNAWACMGGTSMAAPHVAGAVAVARQLRPGASVDQILSALYRSGPAVTDSRNGIARIRVNVADMLALL